MCAGVTFAFLKVIGNFPLIKTWFTQIVCSSKEKFDFFNTFTGILPPAALFVGRSLMIVFISSVVASLNDGSYVVMYLFNSLAKSCMLF